MKKKAFILLLSFSILSLFFSASVSAQEKFAVEKSILEEGEVLGVSTEESEVYDWGDYYQEPGAEISKTISGEIYKLEGEEDLEAFLVKPKGFLPTSQLYPLKRLKERLHLFITTDPKKKEELKLKYQEEKLTELKEIIEKGKIEELKKIDLKKDFEYLKSDLKKVKETEREGLAQKVAEQSAKHKLILEKLSETVPVEAQSLIEDRIEQMVNQIDQASDETGEELIPSDLRQRLEQFKENGCFSQEELTSIYSLKTKADVRKKTDELEKRGCLPKHDLRKLDTAEKKIAKRTVLEQTELDKLETLEKIEEKVSSPEELETKLKKLEEIQKDKKPIPKDLNNFSLIIHKKELEKTARPDLINTDKLSQEKKQLVKKYLEKFKPTEEELKKAEEWKKNNPDKIPPKPIQRIEHLKERFKIVAGECLPCGGIAGINCDNSKSLKCDYGQGIGGLAKITPDASGICIKEDSSSKCRPGLEPEPFKCQPFLCALDCLYGFDKDEAGCPVCKCSQKEVLRKQPACQAVGSKSEGWYWSSEESDKRGELIKFAICAQCKAECKNIGIKSEGWYSSCNNQLIVLDNCGKESICRRQLFGSFTEEDKKECERAKGKVLCGNGWCNCNCYANLQPPGKPKEPAKKGEPCGGYNGIICEDNLTCRYGGGVKIFPQGKDELGICVEEEKKQCLQNAMCMLYCAAGFEQADDGCPICKCKSEEKDKPLTTTPSSDGNLPGEMERLRWSDIQQ